MTTSVAPETLKGSFRQLMAAKARTPTQFADALRNFWFKTVCFLGGRDISRYAQKICYSKFVMEYQWMIKIVFSAKQKLTVRKE